jgi:hypothetical protein
MLACYWLSSELGATVPVGAAGAGGGVVGPSRRDVARTALLNLLQSNVDELFDVCLDKCYDTDRDVANTYFQVRVSCKAD